MAKKGNLQLSPRTTLVSDVVEALRNAIVSGQFEPGERIIESSLADELQISRSTLREALRVLGSEGLITTEPHRGSQVTDITPNDLREVYEMRLALEGLAATKICGTLSTEQVETLKSIVDDMFKAGKERDVLHLNELDMSFHETICRFADNERLWKSWKQMGGQLRLYFAAFQSKIEPDKIPQRHEIILDALIDGTPEKAERVLQDHINDAARRIISTGDPTVNSESSSEKTGGVPANE